MMAAPMAAPIMSAPMMSAPVITGAPAFGGSIGGSMTYAAPTTYGAATSAHRLQQPQLSAAPSVAP